MMGRFGPGGVSALKLLPASPVSPFPRMSHKVNTAPAALQLLMNTNVSACLDCYAGVVVPPPTFTKETLHGRS